MKISGNTILITGATSGIGLAFAERFFREKNKVIICGRRKERLKEIEMKFPGIITKVCDVKLESEREALFHWAVKHHPEINVLINNAGIQYAVDLQNVNSAKVAEEMETNFVAPVHLASLFSKHFISKEESAIINISSGLAFVPIAFMPIYCATKAALHSVTLSLRYQLKNTAVKVFEIAPPMVDTELGHDRREDKTETHGGIHVDEFIKEAMEAIKNDLLEAPIGQAKGLRAKREELFEIMNR